MNEPAGSQWMVGTAARYTTKVTVFNPGTAGITTVVKADARRWSIRFVATGGPGSMPLMCPAPAPSTLPSTQFSGGEQEWKFRDWPAAVIGEWVANLGPGFNCLVFEQLYSGG